jgi:uncharacterized protein YuzE
MRRRSRSQPVRVTYDARANAAYIHLTGEDLAPGRDSVPCDPPDGLQAWVVLDWKAGRLVGIEVLNARESLPADLIGMADHDSH